MVSSDECVVAVVGTTADVPLPPAPEGCELRFITSKEQLAADAADADVVYVGARHDIINAICETARGGCGVLIYLLGGRRGPRGVTLLRRRSS